MPDKRTRGRKLQTIRKRHFDHEPLCVMCAAKGRVTLAVQLDHILSLGKGGKDNGPKQGLCHACHAEKSAHEAGKTYRMREPIGVDGWPVRTIVLPSRGVVMEYKGDVEIHLDGVDAMPGDAGGGRPGGDDAAK